MHNGRCTACHHSHADMHNGRRTACHHTRSRPDANLGFGNLRAALRSSSVVYFGRLEALRCSTRLCGPHPPTRATASRRPRSRLCDFDHHNPVSAIVPVSNYEQQPDANMLFWGAHALSGGTQVGTTHAGSAKSRSPARGSGRSRPRPGRDAAHNATVAVASSALHPCRPHHGSS
eukprot:366255-Chlamydomonas_euryale.AAC.1